MTEQEELLADLRRKIAALVPPELVEREMIKVGPTKSLVFFPGGKAQKLTGEPYMNLTDKLPKRWLRTTGCLAGAGMLLALSTVAAGAQQQQRECFAVAINTQASLGSILIDKCTGKTWLLGRSGSRFSNAIRWFPITTDTNEPTGENLSPR
jgi:hypothetical protein